MDLKFNEAQRALLNLSLTGRDGTTVLLVHINTIVSRMSPLYKFGNIRSVRKKSEYATYGRKF